MDFSVLDGGNTHHKINCMCNIQQQQLSTQPNRKIVILWKEWEAERHTKEEKEKAKTHIHTHTHDPIYNSHLTASVDIIRVRLIPVISTSFSFFQNSFADFQFFFKYCSASARERKSLHSRYTLFRFHCILFFPLFPHFQLFRKASIRDITDFQSSCNRHFHLFLLHFSFALMNEFSMKCIHSFVLLVFIVIKIS